MNYLIVLITLFFIGCSEKIVYVSVPVGTECPRFTKEVDIRIEKLDNDYAKLKWTEVQKLKDFGTSKEKFNEEVQFMNDENYKKLKKSLEVTKK